MNTATKVFLVLLRIAIGWHFLYEGIFKIDSDRSPQQYLTSRYFLQAETGRLRDFFVAPQTLEQLAPGPAHARIDKWYDDIAAYFQSQNNALGEDQKGRLAAVRDELKLKASAVFADPEFRLRLAGSLRAGRHPEAQTNAAAWAGNLRSQLENVINVDWYTIHEEVLKVAAEKEGGQFTSLTYLQSAAGPFRGLFRGLVPDIDGVERLTAENAKARLDRRCAELLDHYRSHGHAFSEEQKAQLEEARDRLKQSIAATLGDPAFQARVMDYRLMLERVRRDATRLDAPYSRERLDADRKRLDTIAGELLGFVNEPLSELTLRAEAIATVNQMKAGPPPRPPVETRFIDWSVKWGLTAIGLCLLAGLFTPIAAAGAALQLLTFYLASPPWPGLPAAMMSGHYVYVDRNLIELIAALLLVVTPTGRWAGLDSWLYLFVIEPLRRRRPRAASGTPEELPGPGMIPEEAATQRS